MKLCVFLILLAAFFSTNAQQDIRRYIDVNGTAEVNVPADQIEFSVQIRVIRETIEDSKKQVDASVANLLKILDSFSLEEDDIIVTPTILGKNYTYENGSQKQNGYFASSSVSFKLKDLTKYYGLSDQLAKDQTIEIVNSYYSLSDYETYNQEAYEKALKAASNKADYMTKALGISKGRILSIDENNQNYPMPYNMKVMEQSDAGGNAVISGKVNITRTIRVKYELSE